MNLDRYTPVATRIARFRADYPTGRIICDLLTDTPERVVVRCSVWLDQTATPPVAVDLAAEYPSTDRRDGPNGQGFALENCATSAVGRALGLLGYGNPDNPTSRASRDEMEQVAARTATHEAAAALYAELGKLAGTPLAEQLRTLATEHGRRLTVNDLAAHPEWAEVVAGLVLVAGEVATVCEPEASDA